MPWRRSRIKAEHISDCIWTLITKPPTSTIAIKSPNTTKKHDPDDKDYEDRFNKQFEKDLHKNLNKSMLEFTKNNKNYQKAVEIADKYGLYSYDELARENKSAIETMDAYVSGRITYEEVERRARQH